MVTASGYSLIPRASGATGTSPAHLDEGGDVGFGAGAHVADDLTGRERCQPAAAGEVEATREA